MPNEARPNVPEPTPVARHCHGKGPIGTFVTGTFSAESAFSPKANNLGVIHAALLHHRDWRRRLHAGCDYRGCHQRRERAEAGPPRANAAGHLSDHGGVPAGDGPAGLAGLELPAAVVTISST